jgi:hypothetical protein
MNARAEYLREMKAQKARRSTKGDGSQVRHDYAPATSSQRAYAERLAKQAGYDYLSQAEKACFGRQKVGGLKRGDMSRLIDWLQSR